MNYTNALQVMKKHWRRENRPQVLPGKPETTPALLRAILLNTLWRWHRERPGFPRGIKLGPSTTVFWEDELDAFAAAQGQ